MMLFWASFARAALAAESITAESITAESIKVDITGLDADETKALRNAITADIPACPAEQWQAVQLSDRLVREATAARRARGDYAPVINTQIDASGPTPKPPGNACWRVAVTIIPGPQINVRKFVLQFGNGAAVAVSYAPAAFHALAEHPPIAVGSAFSEERYETYKTAFARVALERGYFDAAFTEHRVDLYPELRVADIALRFDTGRRYDFGAITIAPNDLPLSNAFIERMAPFKPGEPYRAELLNTFRERLIASGYFASISAQPAVEHAVDGRVPIETTLQPLPKHVFNAGAGFATDIGPRVHASYEDRFVTTGGNQLEAQLNLSTVISDASLSYRLPSSRPAEQWLAFDAGAKRERTETAHSDNLTVGVRRVEEFRSGWRRTDALVQSYERFAVATDRAHTLLLVPSVRFERTRATDSHGLLSLGWSTDVAVSGSRAWLLSDLNFLQLHAQGRLALGAGTNARVLLRGELGSTWVSGFAELPPTYRFFAGGDDSVRGFDFKTLGPRNGTGEVRGGRNLITASVEYEHMFAARWSWAVFTDTGNAFNDFNPHLRYSAGAGVRWHSPVGSIRFDIAHAVDGGSGGIRVHIGIGDVR